LHGITKCDFQYIRPWYNPDTGELMLTKTECQAREKEWNDSIDEYISNGGDSRSRLEIEREAYVTWRGGAKWLACGNPDCAAVDPGEAAPPKKGGSGGSGSGQARLKVTFKLCSKCWAVAFCSPACQKACWKKHHKAVCNEHKPRVTPLLSSTKMEGALSGMIDMSASMLSDTVSRLIGGGGGADGDGIRGLMGGV
jgi:hypothetical protein